MVRIQAPDSRLQRTEDRGQRTEDFLTLRLRSGQASAFCLPTSVLAFVSCVLAFCSGCGNKFFDPTQVGRFRTVPSVNVILDSLGVAEETPVVWEEAEEPQPMDNIAMESDYVFKPDDIIRVAVFELLQEGVYFVNDYVVTETGRFSIPDVGVVEAAGLTETQLEEQIRQILSPSILKEPSVTVTLVKSQQRMFSILGDGVPLPGRYSIPRYDFRLTDALATAGGPRQFNVSYIYVSRFVEDQEQRYGPLAPRPGGLELEVMEPETTEQKQQAPNIIAPRVQSGYRWPESKVVIASSEMMTDREFRQLPRGFELLSDRASSRTETKDLRRSFAGPTAPQTRDEPVSVNDILKTLSERSGPEKRTNERFNVTEASKSFQEPGHIEWVFQDGKWVPVQVGPPTPTRDKDKDKEQAGHIEWVFQDGRWVPVQVGPPELRKPVIGIEPKRQLVVRPEEPAPPDFDVKPGSRTRLIKIPADKLLAGDPRYNIVIKPGDTVHVPVDIIGEFCIMGNVNRTGYINITGRRMTLKMAIAAAGGLGPLAWPKRCEVIRRIGRQKEEIVRVDLDKIASGEQPDFFIKPNDLINVGTHATARWRAILRNAFRATYGFGFVYDRNFADRDFGTRRPLPRWF